MQHLSIVHCQTQDNLRCFTADEETRSSMSLPLKDVGLSWKTSWSRRQWE